MNARTYSFSIIGTAMVLFWGIVATNLLLDPQRIFWRESNKSPTVNERYLRSSEYLASPDRYQGVLLSSSRGYLVPLHELSRDFGGITFKNFSVGLSLMPDYLLLLKFLVRDKQSRNSRLQAVFLLLDVDTLGRLPVTNRTMEGLWPPQVTGEAVLPFWWRNFTAVQFEGWKYALAPEGKGAGPQPTVPKAPAQIGNTKSPAPQPSIPKERIRTRPYYKEQLAMLREFVELCSKNQVRLVVAISPLGRFTASLLDDEDRKQAVEDVSHILPIWDFGVPQWLENEWTDVWHYSPTVTNLMFERIFHANPPSPREGFGVLRGN
jgi:hypothetical protein